MDIILSQIFRLRILTTFHTKFDHGGQIKVLFSEIKKTQKILDPTQKRHNSSSNVRQKIEIIFSRNQWRQDQKTIYESRSFFSQQTRSFLKGNKTVGVANRQEKISAAGKLLPSQKHAKRIIQYVFSMPRLDINKMISSSDTDSGNQIFYSIRVNFYFYSATF